MSERSRPESGAGGAPVVIELDNVSLRYRLAKHRPPSLKEFLIHFVRGALVYEELWALRHVSFAVRRGERVAVIGRNGAGKSTLLRVISRILRPTGGTAMVSGQVAPLLELGTGFDFELSGRENIFLNALLLGRTRRDIVAAIDRIIEFSGLEEFIDSPIRTYSSGMLGRLGFSIATAWQPEILIVDEVLSVGDVAFAARCKQRLSELHSDGTTLLLVSHDAESVRQHADRCLWLDRGRLVQDGPVSSVLERYTNAQLSPAVLAPAVEAVAESGG